MLSLLACQVELFLPVISARVQDDCLDATADLSHVYVPVCELYPGGSLDQERAGQHQSERFRKPLYQRETDW
jgi:hypothetical protein